MPTTPDLEHLDWAIEQRAEIQRTLLALYKCIETHHVSTSDVHHQHMLNHLVGAAFSLWRAVFLADTFRNYGNIQADQKRFLEKVITDNAITFSDDKTNNNWTVGYYLENAKLRLAQAVTYSDTHFGTKLTSVLLPHLRLSGIMGKDMTRFEWESAHYVLRSLLINICKGTTIQANSPKSPPPDIIDEHFS